MMAQLLKSGTHVVPVPGNHGMQRKQTGADGKLVKRAQPDNEDSWRAYMGDLILDVERWNAIVGKPVNVYDLHQPAAARAGK